jgi:hypothetical protein
MPVDYNIYCDESCHLENDKQNAMVLGAVWCPKEKAHYIFQDIRQIKNKNGLPSAFEIKWNKVSPAMCHFYEEIVTYFYHNNDLHFRALIVPDKSILEHEYFNQTHDEFYYKMYFDLLKVIFQPDASYCIYLDIKDTRSQNKVIQLRDILRNNHYDFSREIIKKIQQVRSHEVEIIQLTDILIGAISYLHRKINTSSAKLRIIELIKELSGYTLEKSTLYREQKTNIFIWKSRKELQK